MKSPVFTSLSSCLHDLATIVMIGYFLVTSWVYLPVFERHMKSNALRELLEQVSAAQAG